VWSGPTANSLGRCNRDGPAPIANTITFSGRLASDPPLPVGFEDQLFATLRDGTGATVVTTFTWVSESPALARIDQNGVMHALGEGTATFRVTAAEGTTATVSLPTRVAVASTAARYAGNAEFGEPADGDPSDDFIVRHAQYTASYNGNRGIPNWVSYDLDPTHFGPEDRCDCFTFDPALPAEFTHYTTADYTGAGAFHGFGIDRGHLARSFDRTSASLDNAFTFYFTNIVPQAADLNQGPWAILENFLGDLARFQNREVYIVTGVAGNKGTVKKEGKITIPASTWKVAVILPHDQGLANVDSYQDVDVIAVIMPNDPGVRNVPWETYKTTVDAVEAASGYDLLALLPDPIEIAVESNTKPPSAASDGPYAGTEGSAVAMSAAASSDPDGDALTYAWTFGDGTGGSEVMPSHTYPQNGLYPIRLIVTDVRGLADTTVTTASIANVAPTIAAFDGATLLPGETYAVQGSFSDPGSDSWSATVDYGDGSGVSALALAGATFSLHHRYMAAGTFTVSVRISDDDATGGRVQTVTVLTPVQGVENVIGLVGRLGAGNSLVATLDAAVQQLARGRIIPAVNQLESFLHELDAMVASGRLSAADAAPPRVAVSRLIQSVRP
jgi:DNA/RNA endonuclease G (NUC1)